MAQQTRKPIRSDVGADRSSEMRRTSHPRAIVESQELPEQQSSNTSPLEQVQPSTDRSAQIEQNREHQRRPERQASATSGFSSYAGYGYQPFGNRYNPRFGKPSSSDNWKTPGHLSSDSKDQSSSHHVRQYHAPTSNRQKTAESSAVHGRSMQLRSGKVFEPKWRKYDNQDEDLAIPRPIPTSKYIAQAQGQPKLAAQVKHLLLVIDLNGTLLHRPNKKQAMRYVARPGVEHFLDYITKTHSCVVWSSARPRNVEAMTNQLFKQHNRDSLLAVWGRDKFGLTPKQYSAKLQVYKDLERIWTDPTITSKHPEAAAGKTWDQSNTLLIDDSIIKGSAQPFNILEIPEFIGQKGEKDRPLQAAAGYLEALKWQQDVSAFAREKPFKVGDEWDFEWTGGKDVEEQPVPLEVEVPDREASVAPSGSER